MAITDTTMTRIETLTLTFERSTLEALCRQLERGSLEDGTRMRVHIDEYEPGKARLLSEYYTADEFSPQKEK